MSEFGKGLTYCLGLFIAHEHYAKDTTWLYCAADHLYELIIPDFLSKELKRDIKEFEDYVFEYRLENNCTNEDRTRLINQAKDFLYRIDKEIGIEAVEADYK